MESLVSKEEEGKRRLQGLREGLYSEIEHLRENLNEVRDKNYNLRWEIYHQRGAHYMNMNGYSFLHGNELTAEELLQMEEQMAAAPKGLSQEQIAALPTLQYAAAEGSAEMYAQGDVDAASASTSCRRGRRCWPSTATTCSTATVCGIGW